MKIEIVVNGYARIAQMAHQARRMSDELSARGATVSVVKSNEIGFYLDGACKPLCSRALPDAAVFLDKDKYAAAAYEAMGVRLFNSAAAIEICDDKMLTLLALNDCGVDVPETIAGALCYTDGATPTDAYYRDLIARLGLPIVVKTAYGSMGKGVSVARDLTSLKAQTEAVLHLPHLFQRYVCSSAGVDTRIIVIGGKAVAVMRRKSVCGDFRSNLDLGGVGTPYDPPESYVEAAQKAATALKLDYCGVDLLDGADGKPLLCEVNSNAFFGIESVTSVNVAGLYADHIMHCLAARNG